MVALQSSGAGGDFKPHKTQPKDILVDIEGVGFSALKRARLTRYYSTISGSGSNKGDLVAIEGKCD